MTKVSFISLGCSKNLCDTEVMLHNLHKAGFEVTFDTEEAEIVIINTCGFIESAKQESIDNILDAAELKKWGKCKHVIATGCLVERYREEVMRELPEVEALVGVGSLADIAEACSAVMRGEKYTSFRDKEKSPLGGGRILTTAPHTAYLKIGEGCDNRCTYCAIPLIRGGFRSRTIEDIVNEAKQLEASGVVELNLIAQDTSRYGLDIYGEYSLARLVREICRETSIPWIRLLYCYPDKITDELIDEMRDNPRLVKYMDIPIQHISDSVLARMNRHGGTALIKDVVKKLRDRIPGITLRTTAMVGFPGESEADFEGTLEMLRRVRFDMLYSFIYSPRKGTPAAEMEQIPNEIKSARFERLLALQNEIGLEKNEAMRGKTLRVLCEGISKSNEDLYAGRTDGNKIVFFEGTPEDTGRFVKITVERVDPFALYGRKNEDK